MTSINGNTAPSRPIRVLLVDDSLFILAALRKLLEPYPDINVVGTACDGLEALEMISRLDPQVVCTDYHMPKMDGLQLTKAIMLKYPRPILVISSSTQLKDQEKVFELLEAGAVDVFPKPSLQALSSGTESNGKEFATKLRIVSRVFVFARSKRPVAAEPVLEGASNAGTLSRPLVRMIAIGASTGGPQALEEVLAQIPADFPVPIVCVQHMASNFMLGLIDWLKKRVRLKVTAVAEPLLPVPGHIYFPVKEKHLVIDRIGKLMYSDEPPIDGHRPSVTALFNSVSQFYGKSAMGVLLTGMGRDGAEGLSALKNAGAATIAQDEATCTVFGMPKQAIELGAARWVLPIGRIAQQIMMLSQR